MRTLTNIIFILLLASCCFAQEEITSLRTYNSKTYVDGANKTMKIHAGHLHYKDASGDMQDIDLTFVDMTTYWQMKTASYKIYIAKDFDSDNLIRFDNKFNGCDHTIYYTPHSFQWVDKNNPDNRIMIKAAQSVTGTVSGNTITYANAFGNNVDFVIELTRHGFRKYIRFNTKPNTTPPSSEYVPVLIVKYQGDLVTVKANDSGTDWDEASYYESSEGFSLRESTASYRTIIRRAFMKDSNDGKTQLKVFFELRDTKLWQAKVFKLAFMDSATYPVIADTTTNFYDDGNGGDGNVNYDTAVSWAATHDAGAGNGADDTTATNGIQAICGKGWGSWWITRGYVPIDTSGIPDNATISAATLYLCCSENGVDSSDDGYNYVSIIQTSQASTSSLVNDDFDEVGTTEGHAAGARIVASTLTADVYASWALNSTGIGWISKTGITKFGIRDAHDLQDVEYSPDQAENSAKFYASETAGTNKDPYLSVTYTAPAQVIFVNIE